MGFKTMQDTHLLETQISTQTVFKGHLLEVRKDQVRLPNGTESIREYIVHPGAVVILAFLELPAGKIDPGEAIIETARRELLEETGYIASEWSHLGKIHPCIGYSDERIEIFVARGLQLISEKKLDHNEFLDVIELSPSAAKEAVWNGLITDAKTISSLFCLDRPTGL